MWLVLCEERNKGLKGLVLIILIQVRSDMNELAGLKSLPTKKCLFFKTNEEVIKFIAENDG
jgi:hypothetical protein